MAVLHEAIDHSYRFVIRAVLWVIYLAVVAGLETTDLAEAKFVVDQLAAEGIPSVLQDTHVGSLSPLGGLVPIRVVVRAQDLPRARAWVEDYRRRKAEGGPGDGMVT